MARRTQAAARRRRYQTVRTHSGYCAGADVAIPPDSGTPAGKGDPGNASASALDPDPTRLVVVVLVPIAICAPAVVVFIPPPMLLTPATLARIVQFTTFVVCLAAMPSVFLDGLVKFMVGVSDSALTSVWVFCSKARHCGAKQKRCDRYEGEKGFSDCFH